MGLVEEGRVEGALWKLNHRAGLSPAGIEAQGGLAARP